MGDQLRGGTTIGGYLALHTGNFSLDTSTLLLKNGDRITGKIDVPTDIRSAGMYGLYDSSKIGHIWSMGTGYSIPDTGATFGTLYGLAYKHTNNTTGGTMAGGHQVVVCSNGTPGVALGMGGGIWTSGNITGAKVYGAVFNDYAETRRSKHNFKGGLVVTEGKNGTIEKCEKRLSRIPMVVSDTYGFSIGEESTDEAPAVPIAVAGRVLVYTDKHRDSFKVGDVVCSGVGGTISKIKWWEKVLWPERILGLVSEIPTYEIWGSDDVLVDNRIWIKI